MTAPLEAVRRPALLSGALAVAVAGFAVGTITGGLGAWIAVGLALASLGAVWVGQSRRRVGTPFVGTLGVGAGVVGLLTAFLLAVALVSTATTVLETLVGLVGVSLVALALIPVYGQGSRWLLKAGVGTTFLSVLAGGVLLDATLTGLLVAGAATLLSYDLGENAIGIGEQLGRSTETDSIEVVHASASTAVAVIGVLACVVVRGVGTPGMPLLSFALLLVAIVLFAVAIHD